MRSQTAFSLIIFPSDQEKVVWLNKTNWYYVSIGQHSALFTGIPTVVPILTLHQYLSGASKISDADKNCYQCISYLQE